MMCAIKRISFLIYFFHSNKSFTNNQFVFLSIRNVVTRSVDCGAICSNFVSIISLTAQSESLGRHISSCKQRMKMGRCKIKNCPTKRGDRAMFRWVYRWVLRRWNWFCLMFRSYSFQFISIQVFHSNRTSVSSGLPALKGRKVIFDYILGAFSIISCSQCSCSQ